MNYKHFIIFTIFTICLSNLIKAENESDCTIPNCVHCNKQIKVESCYRCKEGFFVLRSYYGKKDECVKCDSIIPHCTSCSLYISVNCLACEDGYELVHDRFKDDKCEPNATAEDKRLLTSYFLFNN